MEHEVKDKYSHLSVKELKSILSARSVSYEDCVEKSDLVARAKATEDLGILLLDHLLFPEFQIRTKSL
jgi:hypothetical protein